MTPDDFRPASNVIGGSTTSEKWRAWLYVALMMACILLTLPTAPVFWEWATKHLGRWFNDVGYLLFLALFAFAGFYAGRRFSGSDRKALLLLSGFALVYFYLLRYLCKFPAERLHLIEYGLLAYLLYRAFRLYSPSRTAYIFGFLIASGFGVLDEVIQKFLPNRVFEIRDALTNVLGAVLGLLALRLIIHPDWSQDRSMDS